jgi:SAM-dependent methyltransferase
MRAMQTPLNRPWYRSLYDHFPDYDDEPYTRSTVREVDFIERAMVAVRDPLIIDVGCGTARHSLELARRGYRVVGVDLSAAMLAQARRKARVEGLHPRLVQADARALPFPSRFDLALCLCEGGFSLMERDEMDRQILAHLACALRPEGILVLTAPNAARQLHKADPDGGFDPVTLRETFTLEITDSHGEPQKLQCTQRYYTAPELVRLLADVDLQVDSLFAVTGSGYSNGVGPSREEFEMGVIARKVALPSQPA